MFLPKSAELPLLLAEFHFFVGHFRNISTVSEIFCTKKAPTHYVAP